MASQRNRNFSADEEDSSPAPAFPEAPVVLEAPVFPEVGLRGDRNNAARYADAAANNAGPNPPAHLQPLADTITEAVRALLSPEMLNAAVRSALADLVSPSLVAPLLANSADSAPAPPQRAVPITSPPGDSSDLDSDPFTDHSRPSAAKPMPPPVFSGNRQADRVDVDGFLCQCEIYFSLASLPRGSRVLTAVSRLSGTALSWWRGNRLSIPGLDSQWDVFSSHFVAEFRATDEAREARTTLYAARDRRLSVPALIAEFTRQVPRIPDISDGELLHLFLHSLPPDVSPYVLTQRPLTFTEAKRLANLAQSAIPTPQRRPFRPQYPAAAPPQPRPGAPQRLPQFAPRAPPVAAVLQPEGDEDNAAADAAVAAVNIPRPPRLNPEERQRLMEIGACFRCRQPGHQAPNCPVFGHLGNGPRRE